MTYHGVQHLLQMEHHIPKQPTHNKDLEKIKTMATTKAMATIRVMANNTEQTVTTTSNKDDANGCTSVEQILDTARRPDRSHCRVENIPHWGLDSEIHEEVPKWEHQEPNIFVSAKKPTLKK